MRSTLTTLYIFITLAVILGEASLGRTKTGAGRFFVTNLKPAQPKECIDGQLLENPEYCTKFFQCFNGRLVEKHCPNGTVFKDAFHVCVKAGSELDTCTPEHPDRECKRKTLDLIPRPFVCQLYYNCSDFAPYGARKNFTYGYLKECVFPDMYDIRLKKCVSYKNVICGQGREQLKWRCDYLASQCWRPPCEPCWKDYPSCVGKEDGLWPVPYSLWSNLYIECKDERDFRGILYCPEKGMIFNPYLRKCFHRYKNNNSHVDE